MKLTFKAIDFKTTPLRDLSLNSEIIEKNNIYKLKDLINYTRKYFSLGEDVSILEEGRIAAGSICLINETDYELLNKDEAVVKHGDKIFIIASLHGG